MKKKKYVVPTLLLILGICIIVGCSGTSYNYPSDYSVKTLEVQMGILRQLFPELSPGMDETGYAAYLDEFRTKTELPAGAEGLFLIPRWQLIAPTYIKAVEIVLAKLKYFYDGRLKPDYLQQSKQSVKFWDKLGTQQENNNILVVAAQFGMLHQKSSVEQARKNYKDNEVGFGVYEALVMLSTHPERLVGPNDFWIVCPGDEYPWSADVPCLYFLYDDGFKFGARRISLVDADPSLVSGFPPQ